MVKGDPVVKINRILATTTALSLLMERKLGS